VVPVYNEAGEITAVLDIDSKELATFDDVDKEWLEEIVKVMK
jgi:GAF domain-containing protein